MKLIKQFMDVPRNENIFQVPFCLELPDKTMFASLSLRQAIFFFLTDRLASQYSLMATGYIFNRIYALKEKYFLLIKSRCTRDTVLLISSIGCEYIKPCVRKD
ncbi:hypothetical protein CEXT_726411 [Caerostris extrusa]|uniref:Uncharacterized protein n=1 Tax=Caerostris extrusa TaxID=172846 RepID=A0AAV4XPE4_CAEEX|nr:hypothetical protein CEXT_726411 [Caerostris extrusa]